MWRGQDSIHRGFDPRKFLYIYFIYNNNFKLILKKLNIIYIIQDFDT